ncbi:MAG: HD domain-containing protein [Dehalococcoidia bacterium]|nr:HD domain-containing protein [Dehalococcoidia bacterium]
MDSDQSQKPRPRQKILIGDGAEENLGLLKAVFCMAGYDVATAVAGDEVLLQVGLENPDLVILDVALRGLDGFQVCAKLKSREKHWGLPVVLMSSHHDAAERIKGIEAGANDFWRRPLHRADLLARAKALLRAAHSRYNASSVQHAIVALAKAVEARDPYTKGHTERVAELAVKLGSAIGLDEEALGFLRQGALLHDVGKVGIRDSILLKIGPLDEQEKAAIQGHSEIGENICQPLRSKVILEIVRSHHERYDGTGYPDGLGGEAIPLAARIMAIADAYDAMTSNRPYHVSCSRVKALQIIAGESGKHFDPHLAAMFLSLMRSSTPSRRRQADNPAREQPPLLPLDLPGDQQPY